MASGGGWAVDVECLSGGSGGSAGALCEGVRERLRSAVDRAAEGASDRHGPVGVDGTGVKGDVIVLAVGHVTIGAGQAGVAVAEGGLPHHGGAPCAGGGFDDTGDRGSGGRAGHAAAGGDVVEAAAFGVAGDEAEGQGGGAGAGVAARPVQRRGAGAGHRGDVDDRAGRRGRVRGLGCGQQQRVGCGGDGKPPAECGGECARAHGFLREGERPGWGRMWQPSANEVRHLHGVVADSPLVAADLSGQLTIYGDDRVITLLS